MLVNSRCTLYIPELVDKKDVYKRVYIPALEWQEHTKSIVTPKGTENKDIVKAYIHIGYEHTDLEIPKKAYIIEGEHPECKTYEKLKKLKHKKGNKLYLVTGVAKRTAGHRSLHHIAIEAE